MNKSGWFGMASLLVFLCSAAYCPAGIIVDHQPFPTGGPGSDTDFLLAGSPFWQRVCDEIIVFEPAAVRHLTWWGFYDEDNPPSSETMRIRIYATGDSTALPDEMQMLFEQVSTDQTRMATGRTILTGIAPAEFRYDLDLHIPVYLQPSTLYWLEIAQLGDPDTNFRWEISVAARDGYAFINPLLDDWRHTTNTEATLAFQLSSVPEPNTLILFMFAPTLLFFSRRTRKEA